MSTANPTSLKVGASGILDGHRCKVTGRVVMGVTIDGETYYWNEYQLADETGSTAILVYEEEESGPTWKLFLPLELLRGFSALDAARYKVGDSVVFDDLRAQVSLVSQSRVDDIEGEAPEGVEVGDVANYFNADAGNRMLVASWTGSEIEYYKGRTLPASAVAEAFKLPKAELSFAALQRFSGTGQSAVSGGTIKMVLLGLFVMIGLAGRACSTDTAKVPPPPARITAGTNPISLGAHGQLAGHEVTVLRHAVAGVMAPGGNFERHEFVLSAGAQRWLLVQRMERNVLGWFLLTPVRAPAALTPYALAALATGTKLDVDGTTFTVTSLFSATSDQMEGPTDGLDAPKQIYYGLTGRATSDERVLARWTDSRVEIEVGTLIGEQDVLAALVTKK